jgi:hypothetical protein
MSDKPEIVESDRTKELYQHGSRRRDVDKLIKFDNIEIKVIARVLSITTSTTLNIEEIVEGSIYQVSLHDKAIFAKLAKYLRKYAKFVRMLGESNSSTAKHIEYLRRILESNTARYIDRSNHNNMLLILGCAYKLPSGDKCIGFFDIIHEGDSLEQTETTTYVPDKDTLRDMPNICSKIARRMQYPSGNISKHK